MPISDLYSVCRERFLVSSQITLNSHLTEFKDHELVKIKKHSDGQDCLHIPLTAEALQKVVLEITDWHSYKKKGKYLTNLRYEKNISK